MKKLLLIMLAAVLATACEKDMTDEMAGDEPEQTAAKTKKFTFTVKGDFGAPTFTRAYLQADGQSMTDLWVYDWNDSALVQTVHQTPEDADWGTPSLSLTYGKHHVYFLASRGTSPAVSNDTVVWDTPRDTFWKKYDVEVVSSSNGNRAVTLDRVATKLRVVLTDVVKAGCDTLTVIPDKWYYGISYKTGKALCVKKKARSVAVPASYVGTAGLSVSIYGISDDTEWNTDVAIVASDSLGKTMASATITDAPFVRNRATEYSGTLFHSSGTNEVTLSGDWKEEKKSTW